MCLSQGSSACRGLLGDSSSDEEEEEADVAAAESDQARHLLHLHLHQSSLHVTALPSANSSNLLKNSLNTLTGQFYLFCVPAWFSGLVFTYLQSPNMAVSQADC